MYLTSFDLLTFGVSFFEIHHSISVVPEQILFKLYAAASIVFP
jgi:hypothetical protein